MQAYVKLGIAALLPVVASVVFASIDKKFTCDTKFKAALRQIVIGVVFGILAIVGTEWGIPMNGAMVNCRDAAVVAAGLLFGGPAGVIAGLIGGIERWIAVAWGVGTFTRVACSVSTIIAGLYSALCRRFLFEQKRPIWPVALAAGVVMEVFHMMMVFLTNMQETTRALSVVQACTIPMVVGNSVSVMLATIAVTIVNHQRLGFIRGKHTPLSATLQRWLIIVVVVMFLVSSGFMFVLQSTISENDIRLSLEQLSEDVVLDIQDASDANLIKITKSIAAKIESGNYVLNDEMKNWDVSEISIVNSIGVIVESTEPDYVLFYMGSGDQAAEFLCLLNGAQTYVQPYGPISYDASKYMKYAGVVLGDGFIQVGYNATAFQKDLASEIAIAASNRHVGQTGCMVIADRDGSIVSGPDEFVGMKLNKIGFANGLSEIEPNTMHKMLLNGVEQYTLYRESEGYSIIAMQPVAEAMHLRNIAVYANSFMLVEVFGVLFAVIILFVQRRIVKNVQKVNGYLNSITQGNLDTVVDVYTNEEFTVLSNGTNHTVDAMKGFIKEAEDRNAAELEFAKNIQHSVLPNTFPPYPNYENCFDIYAAMYTAKEVGGDFYDFYLVSKDVLAFVVADVSGKGIPAALFMMRAKTQLKNLTENHLPLDEVFVKANDGLCEGNDANMFVTTWEGKMNFNKGTLIFVNAGHNPPLLKKANGKFEYMRIRKGLVLGAMDGVPYKSHEIEIEPGDTLYLYTDGVTEATDAHNELYGEDRLEAILNSREFESMQQLCDIVKDDVDKFVGEAPQFDDITMMAIKYKGPKITIVEEPKEDSQA